MKVCAVLFLMLAAMVSCQKESVTPTENVNVTGPMLSLSGGTTQGKDWTIASFIVTANICTPGPNDFKSRDIMLMEGEEYLRDNIITIFPSGKTKIDQGDLRPNRVDARIQVDKQSWVVTPENDVLIVDYFGQPSLSARWRMTVTDSNIILSNERYDAAYKGSIERVVVTFSAVGAITH